MSTPTATPVPSLWPCLPEGGCKNMFTLQNLKDVVTSPLFVTFLWLFFGMYVNCVVQVYAQYRSSQINASTLPDVGFDLLPTFSPLLADLACYGAMLLTLLRFFFGLTSSNSRIRRHIFRRHILCLGCLFLLRSASIISTMLPNPADYCITDVQYSPFYEAFRILLGQTVTCADVMYSGHTVNITLCSMTWHYYSHVVPLTTFDPVCGGWGRLTNKVGDLERFTTCKIMVWIFTFVGYAFIIGSRFHYTLDVFIGSLLTIVVFKVYYARLRTAHLSGTWFNRLVCWMERGAEDIEEYKRGLGEMAREGVGGEAMVQIV
ncbi:hypothetical protein TrVE_jg13095 [Triparma verrucosa]|uniref:Sphingomyelin synthase-like domain-containing protein n=2 Tax=Triparma TaxID=722752 RepID=A0A9W7A0B2_9STRA|nr:hypothetical protein TrST_g13002 [Triparma strigata]GMH89450.1 hypothetical protein TrVE_jg13095 [Triparma verrucosa]